MAKRLFGGPPLIHHEDGFNEDEAVADQTRAATATGRAGAGRGPYSGRALRKAGKDRALILGPQSGAHPERRRGRRFRAAARARRHSRLRAAGQRGGDRHRGGAARGEEPAAPRARLRRHDAPAREAGDRGRGAGERADRRRGARQGRRRAGADARLPGAACPAGSAISTFSRFPPTASNSRSRWSRRWRRGCRRWRRRWATCRGSSQRTTSR